MIEIIGLVPENEDALYTLAEANMTKERPDLAIGYSARLLIALIAKPKPETVSDADWDSKKSSLTGRGNYIAGVASCLRELWQDCDRFLRAAMPIVSSQPGLVGPINFYLGLSNYRIGLSTDNRQRIQDGAKFMKESASLAGPMQDQAKLNVTAIEKDLTSKRGR